MTRQAVKEDPSHEMRYNMHEQEDRSGTRRPNHITRHFCLNGVRGMPLSIVFKGSIRVWSWSIEINYKGTRYIFGPFFLRHVQYKEGEV